MQAGDAQRPDLDLFRSRAVLAGELDDPAVQPTLLRGVRVPVHATGEGLPDRICLRVVIGRDATADRGVALRLAGHGGDGAAVGIPLVVIGDAVVRAVQVRVTGSTVVALRTLRPGRPADALDALAAVQRVAGTLRQIG